MQAQDEDARQFIDPLHGVLHFFRRPKQKRPENTVHQHAVRDGLAVHELFWGLQHIRFKNRDTSVVSETRLMNR